MNKYLTLSFLLYILFSDFVHAAEMGIPVQLRLKSPSGSYPTETGISIRLQLLSTSSCILREEIFSNQTVSDGAVSISLGQGVRGPNDPNISLNAAYDNTNVKNNLTCVDAAGSIVSTGSSYAPALDDIRQLRFLTTIAGANILVDFPMRSAPWAVQAESALMAQGFSGSVSGDVSGTQSHLSVEKIRGVILNPLLPSTGQVLAFDGFQWSPQTLSTFSGVTSVTSSNSYLTITNSTTTPTLSLNIGTTTNTLAAGNDSRITGAFQAATTLSGDLSGTLPNAVLSNSGVSAGNYGSATTVGSFTVNAKGRITSASSINIALPVSQITQSSASSGQVLKWNGTAWAPAADSDSGVGSLPSSTFNNYVASANCTTTETMYWSSVTSQFLCQTIGTIANAMNATNATTALNFSGSLSGDVNGTQAAVSVNKLRGVAVSASAPVTGQTLVYDGTQWIPKKGLSSFIRKTTDQTTTTTSVANVTDMSFTVTAGVLYKYKMNVLYTSAATTTGLRIGITYPAATITSAIANIPGATTDGTSFLYSGFISTSGDSVMSANSPAVSPTVMMANIEGTFMASTTGVIQLQAASEVNSSAIVIKANSFIELTELP